jgi:hypothetical protein
VRAVGLVSGFMCRPNREGAIVVRADETFFTARICYLFHSWLRIFQEGYRPI